MPRRCPLSAHAPHLARCAPPPGVRPLPRGAASWRAPLARAPAERAGGSERRVEPVGCAASSPWVPHFLLGGGGGFPPTAPEFPKLRRKRAHLQPRAPSARARRGSARTCTPQRPQSPGRAGPAGWSRSWRAALGPGRAGRSSPCCCHRCFCPELWPPPKGAASTVRGPRAGPLGKKQKERKAAWPRVSLADPWGILGLWGIWALNPEPDLWLETPQSWGCGLDKLGNPCGLRAPPAPLPRRIQRGALPACLGGWIWGAGGCFLQGGSLHPQIFVWLLERSCPKFFCFLWARPRWCLYGGYRNGDWALFCMPSKQTIYPVF